MAQLVRAEPEAVTDGQASLIVTVGAYTAGDVIGGLLKFPNAFNSLPGKGELRGVTLFDNAKQAKALTLFLYKSAPSTIADNAAFDPSAADARLLVAQVPLVAHKNYSGATIGYTYAANIAIPVWAEGSDGQALFAYLVADVAPTYAAPDDLTLRLLILQDG